MSIKWFLVPLGILFFIYPMASAGILEDIFGYRYLTSVDDLRYDMPYNPDRFNYTISHTTDGPEINKIEGWIDIVGYENMIYIDGEFYINETVIPIVISDVWCGPMHWNCYWDSVDVIYENVTTYQNVTTAIIEVKMLWHHTSNSGDKSYFVEYATLTTTAQVPKRYPGLDCKNTSVEVVIYNNTIKPKTTIRILNIPDKTLSITYAYDGEVIIHHFSTASQGYTETNCPYMNISKVDYWERKSNLSYFNGFVIIPHMNFTEKNMTITLNDPYTSTELNNTTIYEMKYRGSEDVFSPLLWVFLLVVGVFIFGSYIQLRRLL